MLKVIGGEQEGEFKAVASGAARYPTASLWL
jgi:hypothetical protein